MSKRRGPGEAPVLSVAAPFMELRLMPIAYAATYCGMSESGFRAECPVEPIRIGARVRWDKRALDVWIDSLSKEDENYPDPMNVIEARYQRKRNEPTGRDRQRAAAKATVLRVITENAPCSLATLLRKRRYHTEASALFHIEQLEREKAITSNVVNGERFYRPA